MSATPQDLVRPDILAMSSYHVPPATGLVKLDAMENPYTLPAELATALAARLAAVAINRYPAPSYARLKQLIRDTLGVPAGAEVLVGNGSDELITMISVATAKPGATVVAPAPSFVMYDLSTRFAGSRFVPVPLAADLTLDLDAMLAAIAEHRPAVVWLAYPNNPTGNCFDRAAIERILAAAAEELECTTDDVALIGGDRILARGGRALSLAELAQARAKLGGLSAEGSFASSKRTYSYGAHAAHVSVDARTGHVELVDYVAVEDVGRIINPHTLHGQAMGAVVQGLGGVFLEHLVYDDQGQLLTGSLADYLMPVADSFPCIRAFALENHPSPHNPLGAKGAGEGGIIPVAGVVANAVSAALSTLGVSPRELPLSPSRLWHMIDAARQRAAA